MQTLHQLEYVSLLFHPDDRILRQVWTEESVYINADDYKRAVKIFFAFSARLKPRGVLIDLRDFRFVLEPDVQEWLNQATVYAISKHRIRRMALLIKPEGEEGSLFERIALEQTTDDMYEAGAFKAFKYFSSPENALEWLAMKPDQDQNG